MAKPKTYTYENTQLQNNVLYLNADYREVTGQRPQSWVNRTQAHIVVTINYRVNIFGFPNTAALDSPNLGILDQRLALEWVYANIASFGGDPDSIMLWGQSAGSQNVMWPWKIKDAFNLSNFTEKLIVLVAWWFFLKVS